MEAHGGGRTGSWEPGKYFGDLHDPRTGNAKRHIFLEIPIIAICVMICGADGWVKRLFQPLTHPQVLSRSWQVGRPWTDADEVESSRRSLARLVSGLLHRCRARVYLGLSELGESGFEQRGELLRAFQKIL